MKPGKDRSDVMLSVQTSKKPCCCILDEFEAGTRLWGDTRKKGVAVVLLGKLQCMNNFSKSECDSIGLIVGDGS